jgi:endonuclease-3
MKNQDEITHRLKKHYPSLKPFINYSNHFELIIAVILTAQAALEELENIIRPTGFFRVKAKSIKACAAMLQEDYNGEIPRSIEELIKLPGVGRKTANVVVGHAFDQPAIAVDTHFGRVAYRLGLTTYKDPVKVEKQVKRHIPPADQMPISQAANAHGRLICHARNPKCGECFLQDICPRRGL